MAGRKAFHHINVPALYIGAEAYIAYQHGWIQRRTARFTSDAPNGRL
jgi:hypothetical protein